MIALEALLPSEIARLVYGYLASENCTESAQLFLNESTNLEECRSVASVGRKFSTRVNGYALKDILENFCAVNSVVQGKINQLNNLDDLKHCYDLVDHVKFLLEDYRKANDVNKVDASTQMTPNNLNESFGKSQSRCLCHNNGKEQPIQNFDKSVQTQTYLIHESSAVEATLLKNLPGYVNYSERGKFQTERSKFFKISENSIGAEIQDKNVLLETQNKDTISKQYTDSTVQTSIVKKYDKYDENVMTDIVAKNLNDFKNSEVQTCELGSPDSGVPPSIELLGDITLELLNRSEIQEKIAQNINRILESKKSVYFSNNSTAATKELSSKSFIAEFNKAVQIALSKTENDADIYDLINEVISTEDDADMEVENLDEFEENMDIDFKETISELKNNQEAVLTANGQGQTTILNKQNFDIVTHNTVNTENNQTQIENNPNLGKNCTDEAIVKKVNINRESVEVPKHIPNDLEKIKSSSLNLIESQELRQRSESVSDNFFAHNSTITSTPLKTAIQGLDTCDWFYTEALSTPDIDYHKDAFFKRNPYIASEAVATATALISPIASKDTSNIAEKDNPTDCLTTNALKHKLLNTPDITLPPTTNFPCVKSSVLFTNLSANKDSKSSETKNILPDLHSSIPKSSGMADNSSSLSNEKLFGLESIMLYGMDNNATTLPAQVTIPEIEIEGSMTLTGTGLSPFIKIIKTSKNTEPQKSDLLITNDAISNETHTPVGSTKTNQEPTETVLITSSNITEAVTKNTPKVLKENRLKNNRFSLSTPKKPSSHVRALNFETPAPRSQSESKANEKIIGRSAESIMKELKNACKSSLFRSPEITNVEIMEHTDLCSKTVSENQNLESLKDENIANVSESTNKINAPIIRLSLQPDSVKVKPTTKKCWDEDLRSMYVQPLQEGKKSSKKSKNKSRDREKKEKRSDSRKSKKKDKSKNNDELETKSSKQSDKKSSKKHNKSDKKTPKKSKNSDKKTPNKSKKKNESKLCNDKIKCSANETNFDVLEKVIVSEEPPLVSNGSESKTMDLNDSESMPIVSNGSKSIPIVLNGSKSGPKVLNSVEVVSDDSSTSEEIHKVQDCSKNEISKTVNNGIFSSSVLEALLSSSFNEDDAVDTNDVMKLAAEEMDNISKLKQNESVRNVIDNIDHDIAEKMHQDEELMSGAFTNTSKNARSNISVGNQVQIVDNKKIQPDDVKNSEDCKKLDSQINIQELNTTPPFSNTSIITTISSGSSQKAEVIYDKVNKIERGRLVQKKYARVQTLDTKIVSKSQTHNFGIEMGTLHKDEDTSSLAVPPTPRVLSPGNSCSFLTMPKLGDESQMRSIRSFVTTPIECPLTPQIIMTPPKTQNENTTEALKNIQKTDSSSYFQLTLPSFETLKQSEITQFEVIKENLKDTLAKAQIKSENKINDAIKAQTIFKNTSNTTSKPLDEIEAIPRHQKRIVSSSSCSSSVSCSCCTSSLISATETCTNNNNNIENNYDNNNHNLDTPSNDVPINIEESKIIIATSPSKVFSIKKTDEELTEAIIETPAKDENIFLETGIIDTPNTSKPVENPTNLNTKMCQMIIMKDEAEMDKNQVTEIQKPIIKTVPRILPRTVTKPSQFVKALPLNMQRQSHELQCESLESNLIFQRIKIEKSEEEVAQAVDSITVNSDFKFSKSSERNMESATTSPINKSEILDNTPHKIELVKAIQSITCELDSPAYSPIRKPGVNVEEEQSSSATESNDSNFDYSTSSDDSQESFTSDSEPRAVDNSTNWTNLNATCHEIRFVFDDSKKKPRRKKVYESELEVELQSCKLRPSLFECIFSEAPSRKKKGLTVKSRSIDIKEDSQESSSASSTAFPSVFHNQEDEGKLNVKRKRSDDLIREAMNNKRIKNLDFDQF